MRVGIIGAGAAGLCAIRQSLAFNCDVIAFEQSDKIAGTWVYSDDIGRDKYGNDVHSSMYKELRTNLPKELMAFPDFPFPPSEKSFLPSSDVNAYLNRYADHFNLRDHIKFEHQVIRVRPKREMKTWEVITLNQPQNEYEKYTFDIILVCNGHFSVPSFPRYQGREVFRGTQLHSHHYRDSQRFAGKRVLTIGGGPSGLDITLDIATDAAKVFWSNHLVPPKVIKEQNLVQKVDVQELTADGAIFVDGSIESFDEVVYCTGYEFSFPFLSVDCGLLSEESYLQPLYKHCLSINSPSMGIIGLPVYVCPFQLFDLQIRFCLTFMTEQKELPANGDMLEDMERDMNARWQRGLNKRKAHAMGKGHQDKYYAELASAAGIDPIKPVVLKMYNECRQNQAKDFANYRRFKFTVLDDENFEAELMP